ncbi:putative bzip family transcription factor [Diaporthe ampelina]|uniref:Putative bzip family transcription factor n=1 Tax=Diaporthe ampelina TaxID=1214573 RepID=A0A0G2FH40_9PEZI|nr:putative bzip family transcription factor [Diaporthe ampelina]
MLSVTQAPLGYEIVTVPTFENASFPFDLNPEPPYPNILDQASTSTPAYPLSPYSSLPLPQSMAFSEPTFGRRLQRNALELAYRLVTMPDPPKHRYAEVFGFCMLFEPIDKIRERLSLSLERTASESLNWWQAPFWAAGSSGQHQLQQDNSFGGGTRVGNQGTVDQMKYSFPGGHFGLGPFDAKVSETRDKRIDPRMRIRLPGFEGDFYDPDEVELYLQTLGVAIQPGQDYLTTEVDVAAFKNGITAEQASQGQGKTMTGLGDWPQTLDGAFTPPAPAVPPPSGSSAVASGSTSSTLSDVRTDPTAWPTGDFPDMFNRATSGHDISGLGSSSGVGPESRKRLITLDVNVFIRDAPSAGTNDADAYFML